MAQNYKALIGKSGKNRTCIIGFGDQHSIIELHSQMARGSGIEPLTTESNSVVLPLN